MQKATVLFDGECNVCNSSVKFILKRDRQGKFQFASLQSDIGKRLLQQFQVSEDIDSIVVIVDGIVYTKSSAALMIAKDLDGAWKLSVIFKLIPTFIRDSLYDWFAKNRYKWFGKRETCILPTKEQRNRFL